MTSSPGPQILSNTFPNVSSSSFQLPAWHTQLLHTVPCPFPSPFHAHPFTPLLPRAFLLFCSCSPVPQPHLAPPVPGLSHLLAKKAPTVTRAPSATAPVSTVLTEAQFPSRRRRASSRAPSPYRAVNSAQPPLLWIQSASRVSR